MLNLEIKPSSKTVVGTF